MINFLEVVISILLGTFIFTPFILFTLVFWIYFIAKVFDISSDF